MRTAVPFPQSHYEGTLQVSLSYQSKYGSLFNICTSKIKFLTTVKLLTPWNRWSRNSPLSMETKGSLHYHVHRSPSMAPIL